MKMKKILTTVCAITGALCLVIAPTKLSAFAKADGVVDGVSPDTFEEEKWFEPKEDITFSKNDLYMMEEPLGAMPKTFETVIQLDETQISKGDVIFSNVYANAHGAGSYTAKSSSATSLEIDTKGRPKFYHKDDLGALTTVIFETDVRSEEFVHLAITISEDTANCYVNGVLVDSQACTVNDAVSAYPFIVGADYAEARNTYFKGKMHSLAVYADERTATEIAGDVNGTDTTDENLLVCYDLKGKAGKENVQDKSANDNDLIKKWLFAETLEEKEYDYSMMVLGDTQAMNYGEYRGDMSAIYDYIVANAEAQKVAHVAHLGDICQKAGATEFERAKAEYKKLDEKGIRYSVVAGNHDFSGGLSNNWNTVFGANAVDGVKYAEQYFATENPETALTTAHTFTAGDLDYLLVTISFNAKQEDIAWVDEIIASHPYHNVIISTHAYRNANGAQSGLSSYLKDGEYDWVKGSLHGSEDTNNEIMGLEDLVRKYENIVLTLNGHHPTRKIEYFETIGNHGNKVVNLVIDPTYFDGTGTMAPHFNGGSGMIANLLFSNGGKTVDVNWYSSVQGKYYNFDSVYSFELETVARKAVNVSVRGEGGSASYAYTNNAQKPIKITLAPQAGYYVSKLVFDGENVTSALRNNEYFVEDTSKDFNFIAEFAKNLYKVKVKSDANQGLVENLTGVESAGVGESVRYTVTPKSGWKIESVTFNGQAVEKKDGVYTITVVDGENELAVAYAKVEVQAQEVEKEEKPSDDTLVPETTESGNGVVVLLIALGGGLVLSLGVGLTLVLKKKKNDE